MTTYLSRSKPFRLVVTFIAIAVAGCATSPEQQAAKAQEKQLLAQAKAQGVTCKRERKFGSNQIKQICTSAEQRAAQSDDAQELLERRNREDDFERAARQVGENPVKPR